MLLTLFLTKCCNVNVVVNLPVVLRYHLAKGVGLLSALADSELWTLLHLARDMMCKLLEGGNFFSQPDDYSLPLHLLDLHTSLCHDALEDC